MPCLDIESMPQDTDVKYQDPDEKVYYRRRIGYPMRGVGTMILHAETGVPTGIRNGTYDSLSLYTVSDVTGRYTNDGYVIDNLTEPVNPDPVRFCYHSPYEYARHRKIDRSTPEFRRTIEKWKDMQTYIMVNGVVDPERWKEWKSDNNY